MAAWAGSLGGWSIPGPARRAALLLTVATVVPTIAAYRLFGFAVALAVFLGFVANLTPAARLPWRLGLAAVATTALTGAVATALLGQPVPAACFAALACLVAAPGNITAEVGLQRVITTLAGAVLAGLIALWLARADRADAPTGTRAPPPDIAPEDPAAGTAAETSEST